MSIESNVESKKMLVILTLKQHEDGIWIRRLVQALKQQHDDTASASSGGCDVQVKALEEWLAKGWLVSSAALFQHDNLIGIVNRVSDAAPPALFKACCAIFGAAQSLGIPIVNGPTTYALCANKWCQHVLFQQAKLSSPRTMAYWNSNEQEEAAVQPHRASEESEYGSDGFLIKPNAGGFGAGITRVSKVPASLPFFEDSITLVQHYIPPRNGKVYRVWFLCGKVQCAVERTIDEASNNEFTGACAGGTCSIVRPSKFLAWTVPVDVRIEIESQLLPLLVDAHCGSVEFLYAQEEAGERLYFDLNLLSTLPLNTTVSDPNQVWPEDYDPWQELAVAVWQVISKSATRNSGYYSFMDEAK
jgi:hypothetical protein